MNKSAQNVQGFSPIILLAVVLVVAGTIGYIFFKGNVLTNMTRQDALPPVSERVNPEPSGGNSLFVNKVSPGTAVSVEEVALEKDGYVVVIKDTKDGKVNVGKSELLMAGEDQRGG